MANLKVDRVNGENVLGAKAEHGEAYRILNELALEPRWKTYLENAPKNLIREMVTTYMAMSEVGKGAMRNFPPGYYLDSDGRLVHLATIQQLSDFQHVGFGTVFFRTTHPAVGFKLELESLTWHGFEPPSGYWLR